MKKVARTPPAVIAVDEIDLESGFLMLPQAIPRAGPTARPGAWPRADTSGAGPRTDTTGTGPAQGLFPPGQGPAPGRRRPPSLRADAVDLSFTANRDAFSPHGYAIANLADMAGQVNVTLHAESPPASTRAKLDDGVMEPFGRRT